MTHHSGDHVGDGQKKNREEEKWQHADQNVAEKKTAAHAPEELSESPADGDCESVQRERDTDEGGEEGCDGENRARDAQHSVKQRAGSLIKDDHHHRHQPDEEQRSSSAGSVRFRRGTRRQHGWAVGYTETSGDGS